MDTCTNNPGYSYIYGTCNDSMVILTEGYRQKKKKELGSKVNASAPTLAAHSASQKQEDVWRTAHWRSFTVFPLVHNEEIDSAKQNSRA